MGAKSLSSRDIIGEFYLRLEQNPGLRWIEKISMMFDSDKESETYKWLGQAPTMRQWIGGRQAKGFRENGITIENLKFEATMEVLVDEIRRDKTTQIMTRVREMADRAQAHWAKLLSSLIINAESTACYDGQYFFDTDHAEGDSGSQSNDISVDISALPANQHGSTTAPSAEEMAQSILLGIQQMFGFKDDQGEPLNENANEFLVMVPVSLQTQAIAAVKNSVLTSGAINTVQTSGFAIDVAANPRLTWTDKFSIFRTDGNVKPLIRQEEEGIKVDAIAEGSELEFKEDRHEYGVKAIRNVGYGYWQHACLVTMI